MIKNDYPIPITAPCSGQTGQAGRIACAMIKTLPTAGLQAGAKNNG